MMVMVMIRVMIAKRRVYDGGGDASFDREKEREERSLSVRGRSVLDSRCSADSTHGRDSR